MNSSFKKWLKDNDIEMHSTHNEGKSVVAERFIRTLKNKIHEHMTDVTENVYIAKLDDIMGEYNNYNNTYHRTIEMKPIEVKDNTYIDSINKVNDKDSKFKVGDHIRISKYKKIFAKGCTQNWSEEDFRLNNLNFFFRGHMLLMISMVKKLSEHFMKKNYHKQINWDLG